MLYHLDGGLKTEYQGSMVWVSDTAYTFKLPSVKGAKTADVQLSMEFAGYS